MFKFIIKRFLLIILGILFSLVLLECVLRFSGWALSFHQQYKNNKALNNRSQYTIMCLGESTTQGQYPIQLQQTLNKKYPNIFSVVDCGVPGTTLRVILNSLDKSINNYNPNIAICMMGINDQIGQESLDKQNNISNLKFIKLFFSFYNKPKKQTPVIYDTIELLQNINFFSNKLKKAINLFYQGKKNEAKKIFQFLLKQNPKDEISYYFLSIINNDLQDYINAIHSDFSFMRFDYYNKIIFHYKQSNDMEKVKFFAKMACNDKNPLSVNFDLYTIIKNIISEEEQIKIKEKILNPNLEESNHVADKNYSILAYEYLEQKDYKKAQEFFDKAEQIRLKFPNEGMYNLYKLIVKKLTDKNIKVICMQYPVRNINPLQERLKNEYYYSKLTFISNESNFKNYLMNRKYNDLFVDLFAGDFGHCTDLGNTLIAENIVNTLENILDLKQ